MSTRRAERQEWQRRYIQERAMNVFAASGYHGTTMEMVAEAAEVSKGTLYNYFSDRAHVVIFIENRVFEPLGQKLDEIVGGELPAVEKLRALCTEVIDSVYRERVLVLAMFHKEMLEGAVKEAKAAKRQRAVSHISQILEQGIQSGELRPVPVAAAAKVVLGAITGLVDSMVYSGDFLPAEDVVPPMLDVLLRGLERPSASEP